MNNPLGEKTYEFIHFTREAIFLVYRDGMFASAQLDLFKALYPDAKIQTYENTMTAIKIPMKGY